MITVTSVDGTDIRAFDEGHGPVILVVHPGLDDGRSWGRVAIRLSRRFRVVRIQRRQYRLDLAAPCSIALEAADVVALAKAVGEPMLLVGHSSGGVVALEALVASPASFAGAVLYEPPVVTGPALRGAAVKQMQAAVTAGSPRLRALAPRQVNDLKAIDRLGLRLDAYASINVPAALIGGGRSPSHLGALLDTLASTMPCAEKVVLPRIGPDAHVRSPDGLARVIETLANKVLR
jgi:pimeloyl-ACP methyl ester carboxylesterase